MRPWDFVMLSKYLIDFFTFVSLGSEQMDLPRIVLKLHRGRKLSGAAGRECGGAPEQPQPALTRSCLKSHGLSGKSGTSG